MITLFGLKNCDGCKKALSWCHENGLEALIHDFKKDGLSEPQLERWISVCTIEKIVNKRGTTWRKLSKDQQSMIEDPAAALALVLENSSLIKRPIVEANGQVFIGFDEACKSALIS